MRKTPYPLGGCASLSISSLSATIWSRASRNVSARRSFRSPRFAARACASANRSSSARIWRGDSATFARSSSTSSSRNAVRRRRSRLDSSPRSDKRPYSSDSRDMRPPPMLWFAKNHPTHAGPTRQRTSLAVWESPRRGYSGGKGFIGRRTIGVVSESLHVWVDQDLCTGDGLCVQYAPEVFEFDVDGLAYVKDTDGELMTAAGSRTDVPEHLRLEVIDAAKECPGDCIHVLRAADGVAVAGPDADAA